MDLTWAVVFRSSILERMRNGVEKWKEEATANRHFYYIFHSILPYSLQMLMPVQQNEHNFILNMTPSVSLLMFFSCIDWLLNQEKNYFLMCCILESDPNTGLHWPWRYWDLVYKHEWFCLVKSSFVFKCLKQCMQLVCGHWCQKALVSYRRLSR